MKVNIQKDWESMSEEQEARIRNHPNEREPGYIPEQSTIPEQEEVEIETRHLKSSEILILHI